ncbi:MAG TPA: DNA modification methylase [Porphyromonadaceae bacterium]|nr:DNA modification methylase [Porphyromonadaceae bacterium]
MQTEKVPLKSVNTNKDNPRKIDKAQFDRLVISLLVFPEMQQLRPIVVDETGTALGGNMRYRALTAIAQKKTAANIADTLRDSRDFAKKTPQQQKRLLDYWEQWLASPTATIVRAETLTPEQKREFIIKDNVSFGDWDEEILLADFDMADLEDWGFTDLDDLGVELPVDDTEAEEDDFTDEDAEDAPTRCSPGDIWRLGDHVLMCGDSTKANDVARLMDGVSADLLLTDPPYNVDYSGKNEMLNKADKGNRVQKAIANDRMSDAAFEAFLTAAFESANQAMKPGAAFYIWHADSKGLAFRQALSNAGLTLRENLVWVKNAIVLGRQDYQWKHEPCLYGWKDGAAHYFVDDRSQSTAIEDAAVDYRKLKKEELLKVVLELTSPRVATTVIYENKPSRSDIHPTMKPVKLMARLIKNSSKPGQTVLDLFGGSGTTLIACEQLKRKCCMMEFDPKYCDAILARWEKLTGREAELASRGSNE